MAGKTTFLRGGLAAGIALGAAAVAAGAYAFVRRVRSDRRRADAGPQTAACVCGAVFRVSGIDRHRVHWLAEAPESEPVLSGGCPRCGRPLPVPPR